jgi:signal transduction histidine kinase
VPVAPAITDRAPAMVDRRTRCSAGRTLTADRRLTIETDVSGLPDRGQRPSVAWAGWVASALLVLAAVVLAARADLADRGLSLAPTVVDVAVGLAFLVGAAVAHGSWRCRALFAAVGMAWLAGSILGSVAYLDYLAILAVALTTFPRGHLRGWRDGVLAALALVALAVGLPVEVFAALFWAIAVTGAAVGRWERIAAWFPQAASIAIAAVLSGAWVVETLRPAEYDPGQWLLALELALLVVGIGFPMAVEAVLRERAMLVDRLLGGGRTAGLDRLAPVLSDLLGDPGLRLLRWDADRLRYVAGDRDERSLTDDVVLLPVVEGAQPLAAIVHGSTAPMQDPAIARAVVESVRLTALHERRQANLDEQLAALETARRRLLAATDRQRTVTADRLGAEVVPSIERAQALLAGLDPQLADPQAGEALAVASRELASSSEELAALAGGLAPGTLGDGGLAEALRGIGARCPIPVAVTADPDATADTARETALFYVGSEAVANAIKYARAERISIVLRRDPGSLVLLVSDDGMGGADPAGSGLRGLADRLAVHGGRLRVESPRGAGTTVTARIPVS